MNSLPLALHHVLARLGRHLEDSEGGVLLNSNFLSVILLMEAIIILARNSAEASILLENVQLILEGLGMAVDWTKCNILSLKDILA